MPGLPYVQHWLWLLLRLASLVIFTRSGLVELPSLSMVCPYIWSTSFAIILPVQLASTKTVEYGPHTETLG